jgi:hypothetical protein
MGKFNVVVLTIVLTSLASISKGKIKWGRKRRKVPEQLIFYAVRRCSFLNYFEELQKPLK